MAELNLGIDIKASVEKVYLALTDPRALTNWFAEHTDVSIEDSRYDFWGRSTPDNPSREQGCHRLIRVIPEKLLEFEWRLRDIDSIVQYELHTSSPGCVLTMYHRDFPQSRPNQSSIGDFWSHALEGLRHWLERGRAYQLLDYSQVQKGDVRVSVEIDAVPSMVFRALTDATQMERWIGSKGAIDPKPGGKIDFGWGMGPIKILEIVPDAKLAYSWQWEGEPETIATWTLGGSGGKTRVTIVQSGFAPDRDNEDYFIGWSKFAARLKTMLEEGPDWSRAKVYANEERTEATTTTIDPIPSRDKGE
ncbi:MAG: SRPBCC domain-containing protein [candidate division Zixibacteria bacterium]|nr:SRPBCC domain-containing protein [candidate division Zixibacteria bacterium]MDH3935935.1 SRPBCC domain-containing protein [candidate division Zixibacteria bacterium]MDH4034855.1 SRPBCC domain-containing protein [candidate division Zixibacteria bacterium]